VLKTKPDIIHANSFYAAAVCILAALVSRRKLVLHARDLKDFGRLSKLYGRLCRRIVAVSHAVRNELIKQGISPAKIDVVYNGVDDVVEARVGGDGRSNAAAENRQDHSFAFAQVGQFVPWKNQLVFLKAASQISPSLPDARFLLVGDDVFGRNDAYKSGLLNYVEHSPIRDKVSFLGWQQNMQDVWARVDCLVHPAQPEPFGRVIIEAMAHKVPVIAVRACGPGEIIQNGHTGILVQSGDIEALAEAMLGVVADSEFASRLAAAGYEYVMSGFTAHKTAERIKDVYRETLAV
jgi:glycosyltransferase involved in cell wall biosynthesis